MEDLFFEIKARGTFEKEDLFDYVNMCLGYGSCKPNNPFIDEESDAEVVNVEVIDNLKVLRRN